MNWQALLKGELIMTANIVVGMIIGDLIVRFRFADKLMGKFTPLLKRIGIGPVLGTALAVGIGTSKAGAALLAKALEEERITRDGAVWGTISLSFPAYLRRWPSTLVLCVSMAGLSGMIFALTLLLRSLGRFLWVIYKARGSEAGEYENQAEKKERRSAFGWYKRLFKTLPVAWVFYAAAYTLMPLLETYLRENLGGTLLPLAGWGVASASLASISASLALARGALAVGDLDTAQTVFALLLGNGLGFFTRAIRQNAGYFFGIFPAAESKSILLRNMTTMLPFTLLSIFISLLFII